jgi:hypothetical protein
MERADIEAKAARRVSLFVPGMAARQEMNGWDVMTGSSMKPFSFGNRQKPKHNMIYHSLIHTEERT